MSIHRRRIDFGVGIREDGGSGGQGLASSKERPTGHGELGRPASSSAGRVCGVARAARGVGGHCVVRGVVRAVVGGGVGGEVEGGRRAAGWGEGAEEGGGHVREGRCGSSALLLSKNSHTGQRR